MRRSIKEGKKAVLQLKPLHLLLTLDAEPFSKAVSRKVFRRADRKSLLTTDGTTGAKRVVLGVKGFLTVQAGGMAIADDAVNVVRSRTPAPECRLLAHPPPIVPPRIAEIFLDSLDLYFIVGREWPAVCGLCTTSDAVESRFR